MELKKKNQKLFILVGVLLLFGGISLSYFVSRAILGGNGGSTSVTTAVIKGATLNVEGVLSFEDLDILPGHKSVSSIKVTATGNNELIPYNLIWQGTNTLTTPLNFTIYKTSEQLSVTSTCSKKIQIINGTQALSEECKISDIDKLGNEMATGIINKNETKVSLVKDEFITATSTEDIKYYYIILEYPNLDEPQNEDLNGVFEGEVTVEESNIKPDINILAAYIIQDNGEYKEVEDIPQKGYTINTSKSTCSNGAIPTGFTPNITINEGTPTTFASGATTDEGVYGVSDPVYGGTSYYWRGLVTNNYVKFADNCWRIVRINGDGSMRLIYDGTTCHANEANADSIAVSKAAYNTSYNNSSYVGWTYTASSQRPSESGTASNAKTQLESWYNGAITGADVNKVADGKYCNDRNVRSGDTWSATGGTYYYAGYKRVITDHSPSLACNYGDVYTLKVGLITVDEVMYAGGTNANNISHYLYNGQNYWTMSPRNWDGTWAYVFVMHSDGRLTSANDYTGNAAYGLRPVINLRSDVTFTSGNGTLNNPYIVAD